MTVTEVEDRVTLQKLVRPDPHRSPGLHLSTIIKDMLMRRYPKKFGGEIRPEYIGLGIAVEDALGELLRKHIFGWQKPGEFRDRATGIIMTPDALSPDEWMLEEIKVTWMKYRGPQTLEHPSYLRYHLQGKPYTRILNMRRIRFRVLHLMGDYAGSGPLLKTYVVKYERIEQQETWDQIQQHAEDVGLLKAA